VNDESDVFLPNEPTPLKDSSSHSSHRTTGLKLGSARLQAGYPVPTTDTLVDLSFDMEEEGGVGESGDELIEGQAAMSKIFYPPGYSDSAVAQAVAKHKASGQVGIVHVMC